MKVLAVASAGGHWIQLLRIRPAFEGFETIFVSTKEGFGKMVEGNDYYYVKDASRWDKFALVKSFYDLYKIIKEVKPNIIITTGAAPGLMALIIGKIMRKTTIWVDSIANVEDVSMSGKIAAKFADRVYTQWPDLSNKYFIYSGNVLS